LATHKHAVADARDNKAGETDGRPSSEEHAHRRADVGHREVLVLVRIEHERVEREEVECHPNNDNQSEKCKH
jgi:hypothetical protein